MVERSVKVKLIAEINSYESNMRKAAKAAEDTGDAARQAGDDADKGMGKLVDSADNAAKANDKVADTTKRAGDALRGTVGDVDKFGNALSEADVAAGRYVNAGGRVAEANGQMASGFGKAREATEKATESADEATGVWGRLATTAQENDQAWSTVSTTLLGVGAAAVAGAGLAVKTFADYDKAMSSVQAATHASEEDMEALGEAAVTAGAETAFSAKEAAAGIEELAKAGVATEDILGGGLDGTLSLAAAGALEVGEAAEIAASALTQFKLEGEDVEHVADLLAAGAGKAQGSVEDLGGALEQVGLVAAQSDLTIEETVGGLAAFASAGLTGSDAGTSFKTMLQRLNPQSEAAATLMDELGLSAYDSQGNFVGLSEYAGQLQTALQDMSTEQRNATMNTLFGSDAVRAAAVLYEQGSEGVQKWEDAVNDAGYAAETAALMQDNLAGDLEKLGGAFDTVFLQAGTGANDALRGAVHGLEGVVDAVGRIPGPILTATTAIAGVGGAGLIAVGGVMKGVSAAAEFKDSLGALGVSSDKTKGKLAKVAKAAGGAAAAFAALRIAGEALDGVGNNSALSVEELNNALTGMEPTLEGVNKKFAEASWANGNDGDFSEIVHGTVEGVNNVGDAVAYLGDQNGMERFGAGLSRLIGISPVVDDVAASMASLDSSVAGMVTSGNLEGAGALFADVVEQTRAAGGTAQDAADLFPELESAILDYATSLGVTLTPQETINAMMGDMPPKLEAAAGGSDELAEGMAGVAAESEEAALSLEEVIDAMSTLGMIQLDAQAATGAFHDAMRGIPATLQEIIDAEGKMGAILTANGTAFDVTTEAGYAAQQAYADIATSGWDMVEASAAAGASLEDTTADLWGTYNGLVASAGQFDITGDAAHNLAREAMGIPDNVDINTWMSDAAQRVAETTSGAVDGVDDHVGITTSMDTNARAEAERLAAAQDQIDREIEITTTQKQVWDDSSLGRAGLVDVRSPTQPGVPFIPPRATGGRIPGLADGGRLPYTGLGTDQILGVSSMTGQPTAWVDDREWVVNQRSSDKYNALLGAVNRDDPSVRHLAGFAAGGRPASREFSAAPAFSSAPAASAAPAVTAQELRAAVAEGISEWRPSITLDNRTIYGVMTNAEKDARRR